jgi:tetratricopeptide (TPR) repeat protein
MQVPDWRKLHLHDGVLAEPVPEHDRIVVWVPGNRVNGYQEWERIGTARQPKIVVNDGACAAPATSILARQPIHGFLGKLLRRFRGSSSDPIWNLPNGSTAEQFGERQTDLLLVWPLADVTLEDQDINSRWPDCHRTLRLGERLFVIRGATTSVVKKESEQLLPEGSPRQIAEKFLSEARNHADPGKLVSALTDLGILLSGEGQCKRSIELLEEALALARKLQDRVKERDVLGNLGLVLARRDPPRALKLLQEELELARTSPDSFAQKTALHHLGLFYLSRRDSQEALVFLEEALGLARNAGDRQHEAEVLWLFAIGHVEAGGREQGEAYAQQAINVFETMGKPQAKVLAEHLRKYRIGENGASPARAPARTSESLTGFFSGGSIVASGWSPNADCTTSQSTGAGWLRMGFSAAKAMGKFLGSGMKRVSMETYQHRERTCAACEHHTGLRCKLCGCFTSVKAWLPREECPIQKWPSTAMSRSPR